MQLDLSRIKSVMNVRQTESATVAVVGVGGAHDLVCNLARCGVRQFVLVDYDKVAAANVARQGHTADEIGTTKVQALAKRLQQINPAVEVIPLAEDFVGMTDETVDRYFADCDLLILATDNFAAQARGNEVALRLQLCAIWVGLYRGGVAGEIIFWHPDLDPCFRCLVPSRYEAQHKAQSQGRKIDPASNGATIFDITFLDAIAGQVAVGLITRGSNDRFGRLIDQLGDRNFLQVKIDPSWTFNGRDVIRQQLGVSDENDALFAWNTIARRDPDGGRLSCPDCQRFRGHTFTESPETGPLRIRPDGSPPATLGSVENSHAGQTTPDEEPAAGSPGAEHVF